MSYSWVETAQVIASVATVAAVVVLGPLFKLVWTIRRNDLSHLDEKIDSYHRLLSAKIDSLQSSVAEVGERMNDHVQWHMEHPQK